MFDAHKNLAVASIATAPSPASSGTSLVVGAGQGARFPAVPFNATIWPVDMAPDPTTAEVVRVTARTSDTLTITRAQEGTTARTVLAGDLIAATITALSLTDIESGTNFPLITTPGAVTVGGDLVLTNTVQLIRTNTADGADNHLIQIASGGTSGTGSTRGAHINLFGNEYAGSGASLTLAAGDAAPGVIDFITGAASRGSMHRSGGFSWGGSVDPGAGNLSVTGTILPVNNLTGTFLNSTGATGAFNRAIISNQNTNSFFGVEGAANNLGMGPNAGYWYLDSAAGITVAAAHAAGGIRFTTGGSAVRGTMHPSGGFSWGSTTDPKAQTFAPLLSVNGSAVFGTTGGWLLDAAIFAKFNPATQVGIMVGTTTDSTQWFITFTNAANQMQGNIAAANASTVQYNTTSDQRLKRDRGPHTDLDVLRRTVVHDFTWRVDDVAGRGVFAQEALEVAPFAVSVGTDERDAGGNLTRPWGVDYSKYVPDLIVGWQDHDATVIELRGDVAVLTARLVALEDRRIVSARSSLMSRVLNFINGLFPAWVSL